MAVASDDSTDVEKLYQYGENLNESQDKSQNLKDYEGIIEAAKGSIKAKQLAAQLIPRFFKYFPSLSERAIFAHFDLCEEEELGVRVQAIRGLPLFCKDTPEYVSKIVDILGQLLTAGENVERDAVHKALLSLLRQDISSQKKKTGVIAPKRFVQRVRKQNELFRSYMHQDAHEFLNYLLNELVDILEKESHVAKTLPDESLPSGQTANGPRNAPTNGVQKEPLVTWVHKNFQGLLTNETRCLRCETVTARDETFLDLSLDIEQNSSITSCLKNFSSTETLNAEDKFFCDKCCSLQEAQKRMKIKKPPHILVIHLKRFKYMEQLGRHKKLSYRVVFPLELKLANSMEDVDSEYTLFAVVVHVGSGPNHGHYVSLVKSHNHWLFFDDENVEMIDESAVQTFFGSAQEYSSNTDHGYILFYESLAANGKG